MHGGRPQTGTLYTAVPVPRTDTLTVSDADGVGSLMEVPLIFGVFALVVVELVSP